MRKTLVAALTVILLAAGIFTVLALVRGGPSKVPPRPQDTSLEFWLCDDMWEFDWSGHDEIGGWFGAREYLGTGYRAVDGRRPETRVSYILTAWPDYADGGSYVTTIEITDPAVSVYGLTVNSEPEEFQRVMESMGYEMRSDADGDQTAVRGDFSFTLRQGELRISARVSNRDGIVF